MAEVRIGIVGMGSIGAAHARSVLSGGVRRCRLTALCNRSPAAMEEFGGIARFRDSGDLIRSGLADAVLIATPHPSHVPIGIDALRAGLHVLVEKPLASDIQAAARLLAAHRDRSRVFAIMFNQRTDPRFRRIRELMAGGSLGSVQRVSWVVTDWFRTQAYYDARPWRGTWKGEGGGVLVNQAPHQLDLYQWLFGMPSSVRAFCGFGKHHDIEAEDEVTAFLKHHGGMTSVFVASTGEWPGTNRLEVDAEGGRIVLEGGMLTVERNGVPARRFSRTSKKPFGSPSVRRERRRFKALGSRHAEIIANFVEAILDGAPLIAPAEEGLRSLELANAMIYSSVMDATVALPLSARRYSALLKRMIARRVAVRG